MEKNLSEYKLLIMLENTDFKYKEILLEFLKCKMCKVIMQEPTFCWKCNFYICLNCNKKNCNDFKLQTPRHLKEFLEKTKLNCLNYSQGCNKISNYIEMRIHINSCQYNNINNIEHLHKEFVYDFANKSKGITYDPIEDVNSSLYENSSSVFLFDQKEKFMLNHKKENNDINSNNIHINQNVNMFCFYCNDGKEFININELFEHWNSNFCKKPYKPNEIIDKSFHYKEEYESYRNECLHNLNNIKKKNFEILNRFFTSLDKEYGEKEQKINVLEENEKKLKINLNLLNEGSVKNLENYPEIKELQINKNELNNKKKKIEIELSKKTNQLNQLTSYSIENDILNNNINFLNKKSKINNINQNKAENKIDIIELNEIDKSIKFDNLNELNSMEQKLIKLIDEIEPGIIPLENTVNYNICYESNDKNMGIKKIKCEEYEAAFCEDKCIKLCLGRRMHKNK